MLCCRPTFVAHGVAVHLHISILTHTSGNTQACMFALRDTRHGCSCRLQVSRGPPHATYSPAPGRLLVPHARAPLSAPPGFDWAAAAATATQPLPATLALEHVYGYNATGAAAQLAFTAGGALAFCTAAVAVVATPPSTTTPACKPVNTLAGSQLRHGDKATIANASSQTRHDTAHAESGQHAEAGNVVALQPFGTSRQCDRSKDPKTTDADLGQSSSQDGPAPASDSQSSGQWSQKHFRGHTNDVLCLCSHPDGRLIATGQVQCFLLFGFRRQFLRPLQTNCSCCSTKCR